MIFRHGMYSLDRSLKICGVFLHFENSFKSMKESIHFYLKHIVEDPKLKKKIIQKSNRNTLIDYYEI